MFPTWKELKESMNKNNPYSCLIFKCIYYLWTHPEFNNMTHKEIYESLVSNIESTLLNK